MEKNPARNPEKNLARNSEKNPARNSEKNLKEKPAEKMIEYRMSIFVMCRCACRASPGGPRGCMT